MMKLNLSRLKNFFSVEMSDPETELSGQLFRFITLSISALFFLFSIQYAIQGESKIAAMQMVVSFLAFTSFGIYKRTKSTTIAGNFILCFGVISAFMRAYLMGGISSPAFFIWPIIPVATMALMPPRWSMLWTGLYIGIALFFHFADRAGYSFPTSLTPESLSTVRIFAIVVVQLGLLAITALFKQLNFQYRQLVKSKNEEKTNLVRTITHDIATPLLLLNHYVQKLEGRYGESLEFQKIYKSINKIQSITNEVKELEAIQSGKRSMQLSSVNLIRLIKEQVHFMEPQFQQKNIKVDLSKIQSNEDCYVMAEESSLANQVLGNILSNAIKFTPEGGCVQLTVEIHTDHDRLPMI